MPEKSKYFVPPFEVCVGLKREWPPGAVGIMKHHAALGSAPVMSVKIMEPTKAGEGMALMTARFIVRIHNAAVTKHRREQRKIKQTKLLVRKDAQQCHAEPQ